MTDTAMTIHRAVTILADGTISIGPNATYRDRRAAAYSLLESRHRVWWQHAADAHAKGFGMRVVSRTVPATERTI